MSYEQETSHLVLHKSFKTKWGSEDGVCFLSGDKLLGSGWPSWNLEFWVLSLESKLFIFSNVIVSNHVSFCDIFPKWLKAQQTPLSVLKLQFDEFNRTPCLIVRIHKCLAPTGRPFWWEKNPQCPLLLWWTFDCVGPASTTAACAEEQNIWHFSVMTALLLLPFGSVCILSVWTHVSALVDKYFPALKQNST